MKRTTWVAALAAAALAGAAAGGAVAHDDVKGTTPARGAVLKNLPAKVSITFSAPVGRLERVRITRNGKGDFVKAARIDPRNAARLIADVKRPGARHRKGVWRVTWRVTGADGHTQVLKASFRVR